MRTKRLLAVLAAMLLLVVGLSACGSDSKDSTSTASGSSSESGEYGKGGSDAGGEAEGDEVYIKDFEFSPKSLKVKAGDEVTIENEGGTDHTFTLDDGSFDSGHIKPDGKATHTFDSAGSYSYHCEIHSSMKGTIEVE